MQPDSFFATIQDQLAASWQCHRPEGRDGVLLVVTDFVLPSMDDAELALTFEGDEVTVSDEGDATDFLLSYGINLLDRSDAGRRAQAEAIARRYGATFDGYEISKRVQRDALWSAMLAVTQAMREVCGFYATVRAAPVVFKSSVASFFKMRDVPVEVDVPMPGWATPSIRMDLRLDGERETLIKTLSSSRASYISREVRLASFDFNDLRKARRDFQAAIVFDDTDPAYRDAWKEGTFGLLRKLGIAAYGLEAHRAELEQIAERHRLGYVAEEAPDADEAPDVDEAPA